MGSDGGGSGHNVSCGMEGYVGGVMAAGEGSCMVEAVAEEGGYMAVAAEENCREVTVEMAEDVMNTCKPCG